MPIGTVHGRDAMMAHVRRGMALFGRTVHLGTNAIIEVVDGARANTRGAG
ncbi:nuclear transport factor 2 family protein [Streptomyces sp. NPDC004227]